MLGPREERLSWDDLYMTIALVVAQRSADPNTQVGATLCSEDHRFNGAGYNGPPKGISVHTIPWDREGEPENTKYPYIIHAEYNCISNAIGKTEGNTLYVTLHPCAECSRAIIQAGIKRVVYFENKYRDLWQTKVANRLLEQANIIVDQHMWGNLSPLKQLAEFIIRMDDE